MGHYVISFTVYTLAMSGLIFFALYIYKKVMNGHVTTSNTKKLSIEETMTINPRKSLMIVKAGNERFLIASDIDKTTFLAKLGESNNFENIINNSKEFENIQTKHENEIDLETVKNDIDNQNIDVLFPQKKKSKAENNTKSIKTAGEKSKIGSKDKTVHLEVIHNRNPKAANLNRKHGIRASKNVNIEVGQIKNRGLSTIKEMVHKVNEL